MFFSVGPAEKLASFPWEKEAAAEKWGCLCGKGMALRGLVDKRPRKSSFLLWKSGLWAIYQDLPFITLISINHRKFAVDKNKY